MIGDIPFEDERLSGEQFRERKEAGQFPFGQVPVLTVDGTVYTQSLAIARYCGKLSGLYPRDDDLSALAIDEVFVVVEDVMMSLFSYRGPDKEQVKRVREDAVKNAFPRLLGGLERIVKKRGDHEQWLCGSSITLADLVVYYMVGNICHGFVDYVSREDLEAYPRLMASYKAVEDHPKVISWNEKHPWKR